MTKIISIFIIVLLAYGGWHLYLYWLKVDAEKPVDPDVEATQKIWPDGLEGMPRELDPIYKSAVTQGPDAVKAFLKRYAKNIQDPRLAWIELDYMITIARDDPAEAKKIFEDVKGRIPEDSRIYPRIRMLSKTYE